MGENCRHPSLARHFVMKTLRILYFGLESSAGLTRAMPLCNVLLTAKFVMFKKTCRLKTNDVHRNRPLMRIKVHCQNRIGILRDILDLLVAYGVNVARGEVGGEHGDAIYLFCPNLINLQFQALRPKFEAITGVFGVKRVGLMPSERRHMELNALLGALDFPVLSIDMAGAIVAANRAAAQLLGVRVDEVPGIALSRYAEDFDLPALVRSSQSRINGLRVKVRGDVFLADIAPLQSEHDDSEAMAGAVLTLHRAD
ncbi:Phenylalanine hydroxylase transcriptional activator PhhR, partial [Pseudomonas syringae pv. maculicola]